MLLAFVVAMATLGMAGCGTSSAVHGKTLRIPLYSAPGPLDPARASTASSVFVDSLVFSGLVKLGPDLHVIPELAVSMPTISNDARTYTFTVRQDARFADGRPCTAQDVAYSLTRALSQEIDSAQARYYLGGIMGASAVETGRSRSLSGVRVLDRLTVRLRLSRPDALFLDKLALPWASVVKRPGAGNSSTEPSGLGPWVLVGRGRDGTLTLRPRTRYYGSSLQIRSLVLVPVPSFARAVQLYHKGALDVVRVLTDQYRVLSTRSDFHQSTALDAYYAMPDPAAGVILAAGLNREMLVQNASPSLSALDSIVPPAVPDYVSSAPALDAPSVTPGDPQPAPLVSLTVSPAGDPMAELLGRALARQWRVVRQGGVKVTVVHAWATLPDPSVWLALAWGRTRSRWFHSGLTHAGTLTNDPVSRMSAYSAEESWALARGILIPLASGSVAYLVKPAVQSLQVTPVGIMPANNNWSQVSITE